MSDIKLQDKKDVVWK